MGIAYLPDGQSIDYDKYIKEHPHWQAVRQARLRFDNGKCVVCHCDVEKTGYETHHLTYIHLGNEHLTDVITLCPKHHVIFHNNWRKQEFWKGREKGHWEVYDIEHTAKICLAYYQEDKFICKDENAENLCNKDIQRALVDRYFREFELSTHPIIDPNDIGLFVRNKRYEMFFEAEARGLSVEEFLDECYGEKIRGKNPLRQEVGKKGGTFDHSPKSFHAHYSENPNINKLMAKVKEMEEKQ